MPNCSGFKRTTISTEKHPLVVV